MAFLRTFAHSGERVWMNPARAGLAVALLAALGALAVAQTVATLSGQIRDAAGKPLAGVTVAAQLLPARATRLNAISDPRGQYQLRLTPGRWRIEVRKPGYATVVVQRRLSAGAAEAKFELTPALPTHPVIPSATAENTPLNGRDWTQLATLQPGVSGVETENSAQGHTAQRGFGAALSISGARPEENDYVLDGISISDYSNGAPGSVVGAALGVDAVQRITELGSNYSATVGRTGGGVISAATRSGGDAWHGSLYEFLRNSALDARNFFDTTRPPFRRNQFGASIGGPMRWGPDKFVFADYEGLRQALGLTTVDTVPSAAARAGRLAAGAIAVDPSVARFVAALYPLPNGPLLGAGDTGIYRFSGQQITGENYFTSRFDWRRPRVNDSVSYLHDGSGVIQPDAYNNLVSSVLSRRQMVAFQDQRDVGAAALNT
ncbi:MAG: carboxypeptidase regulatory-like domain-containing protein, partial [Terriglobales bacterium]